MKFIVYYLIIINIISFFTMGYDKKQAKIHGWRIPEARIFLLAVILGGPGVLFGMIAFRHKTKHHKFVYGIPCIIIIEVIVAAKILGII